jgi:hypothetical protein
MALTGTLNHNAANLNQLAKKHNSVTHVLTLLDRVDMLILCKELKDLVTLIRKLFAIDRVVRLQEVPF